MRIQISGIQHYMYCKRRWALIYIENLWKDNFLTLDGDKVHEKVHDSSIKESRKDKFIERGIYIESEQYNLVGQCDVIEFHKCEQGVPIKSKDGLWNIIPIEYKHGDGSSIDVDKYQLFAQILCLEEMYVTKIEYGYIYYKKSNKKIKIDFTDDDRNNLIDIINEIHELFNKKYTPIVKYNCKKCNNCSMFEICNPKLLKNKDIKKYLKGFIDK